MLDLFGDESDHALARIGYLIAFPAVLVCAPLLIIDLTRPERFWHMLVQSQTFLPMFKWWSPMSVGSWALLLFGAFTFVSFVGALMECGWLPWRAPRFLAGNPFRHVFGVVGTLFGFFLASYTGVLLSVTNGPIWADSSWIGLLFLVSAASTGAAAMLLLARRTPGCPPLPHSRGLLRRFDSWVMWLELVMIALFLFSLGAVAQAFLSVWGLLLIVGVVILGILIPLALHWRPRLMGSATVPAAAVLALLGGFILRAVVVLSSQTIV
jgi:formate-dependent nitrite reductase membrane component NrfD